MSQRKILAMILVLLYVFTLNAYDFKTNDICYSITSEEDYTVGVARNYSLTYVNGSVVENDGGYSEIVTIPEIVRYNNKNYTVTSVEDYAFYNSPELIKVTIPSTVTKIGYEAFPQCSALQSVVLGSSITNIASRAFYGCSSLTNITIPNTVRDIGTAAFSGCTSLTDINIPDLVESIESYTFSGCTALTKVTIGNSVTHIGNYAFGGCTSLGNISLGNSVISIGEQAFNNCSALTSVVLPNSTESIGKEAFYDCSSLTDVSIGNSVASIGTNAFRYCTALKSIIIPNSTTTMGKSIFSGCTSLTNVVIGNSVESIDDDSFFGCSALTNIIIGNAVKSIGLRAFYNCTALTEIDFPSVTTIHGDAFYNCSSLATIIIPNSVTYIHSTAFSGCTANLYLDCNVPDKAYWFQNSSFRKVFIGDNVTTIGAQAFQNCNSIISFTMGKNVETIGVRAFEGCTGITSISIPKGITSIPNMVFLGCSGLKEIVIEDCESPLSLGYNDYYYPGEGSFSDSPLETIYIGRDLEYNPSIYYGYSPFYGMDSIGTVTIGSHVKSLGENILKSCNIDTLRVCTLTPPSAYSFDSFVYKNSTLEVPYGTLELFKSAEAWKEFYHTQEFGDFYILTYMVDNCVYATDSIASGTPVNVIFPIKEGYIFNGWSEIPETMPAHDVTVTGSFTINKYKLTYTVNGEEYATDSITYGETITLRDVLIKEGHTFSGWGEVPATMPAYDVTVEGAFAVNSYRLTYQLDGAEYSVDSIAYGTELVLKDAPTKEGYIFSGWSEIPETMPAHDVVITGSFEVNGIDEITTDTRVDVYNLQGIKVQEQVPFKELENILPKGIYIVNRRKVMIK